MAHSSPTDHRTDKPLSCAQPNSASGLPDSCSIAVNWVSGRCDGPRSVELASRYAYGPSIAPALPNTAVGRRSEASTNTPAAINASAPTCRAATDARVRPSEPGALLVVARRCRRRRWREHRRRERVRLAGIDARSLLRRLDRRRRRRRGGRCCRSGGLLGCRFFFLRTSAQHAHGDKRRQSGGGSETASRSA